MVDPAPLAAKRTDGGPGRASPRRQPSTGGTAPSTRPPSDAHQTPRRESLVSPSNACQTPQREPLVSRHETDDASRRLALRGDLVLCPVDGCAHTSENARKAAEHALIFHYGGSGTTLPVPLQVHGGPAALPRRSWPLFVEAIHCAHGLTIRLACPRQGCSARLSSYDDLLGHARKHATCGPVAPCQGCFKVFLAADESHELHQRDCALFKHRPEPARGNATHCRWGDCNAAAFPNAATCVQHIVQCHLRGEYNNQDSPLHTIWKLRDEASGVYTRRPDRCAEDAVAVAYGVLRHMCVVCLTALSSRKNLFRHYDRKHSIRGPDKLEGCDRCKTSWPRLTGLVPNRHVCHLPVAADEEAAQIAWNDANRTAAFPRPCVPESGEGDDEDPASPLAAAGDARGAVRGPQRRPPRRAVSASGDAGAAALELIVITDSSQGSEDHPLGYAAGAIAPAPDVIVVDESDSEDGHQYTDDARWADY